MFQAFKAWLIKQLSAPENVADHECSTGVADQNAHEDAQHVVPYDENLLERSRTQWHFGDWESLAKLERATLQHHPDRAKLALLTAAGHLQQGNSQEARQFTRLAQARVNQQLTQLGLPLTTLQLQNTELASPHG